MDYLWYSLYWQFLSESNKKSLGKKNIFLSFAYINR